MRKAWLLIVGVGLAGCVMTLLLLSTGVLQHREPGPVPSFSSSQEIPVLLADIEGNEAHWHLPMIVPGTDLLAVRLGSYEGPFLEDGSNRNVFNITMLEIRNTGKYMVRDAGICLTDGNKSFHFRVSFLPPGATVLALDLGGRSGDLASISFVSGYQTVIKDKNFGLFGLEIQDVEMGKTLITNCTEKDISNLVIYYKPITGTGDCFVGGVAYSYQIENIASGETIVLNLPYYAMGSSKIVAAEK